MREQSFKRSRDEAVLDLASLHAVAPVHIYGLTIPEKRLGVCGQCGESGGRGGGRSGTGAGAGAGTGAGAGGSSKDDRDRADTILLCDGDG